MKKFAFMAIALAMLVAFTGMAMADPGINAVPETQGIVTSTAVQAVGTVTETDSIVWQLGYPALGVPLNPDSGKQYVMSYTEGTIADQGLVSYTKGQSLDTANKVAGTNNFATQKVVDFVGLDTGRMISSREHGPRRCRQRSGHHDHVHLSVRIRLDLHHPAVLQHYPGRQRC